MNFESLLPTFLEFAGIFLYVQRICIMAWNLAYRCFKISFSKLSRVWSQCVDAFKLGAIFIQWQG